MNGGGDGKGEEREEIERSYIYYVGEGDTSDLEGE